MVVMKAWWAWVGLGGALGAAGRFSVGSWFTHMALPAWSATAFVNLSGCLLMGLWAAWVRDDDRHLHAPVPQGRAHLQALVGTGFLGGWTTMSSFVADLYVLLTLGTQGIAALDAALSILGGFALLGWGYSLAGGRVGPLAQTQDGPDAED